MAYVKQQLGDHAATRDMYEMARKNGKEKGVKDYAKKTLPVVEQHYDQLQTMDMRIGTDRRSDAKQPIAAGVISLRAAYRMGVQKHSHPF